jgi:hypothetical protein
MPRNAVHGLAPVCVLGLEGNPAPALGHGSGGQIALALGAHHHPDVPGR